VEIHREAVAADVPAVVVIVRNDHVVPVKRRAVGVLDSRRREIDLAGSRRLTFALADGKEMRATEAVFVPGASK